jgi:hypothetical protein
LEATGHAAYMGSTWAKKSWRAQPGRSPWRLPCRPRAPQRWAWLSRGTGRRCPGMYPRPPWRRPPPGALLPGPQTRAQSPGNKETHGRRHPQSESARVGMCESPSHNALADPGGRFQPAPRLMPRTAYLARPTPSYLARPTPSYMASPTPS